MRLKDKTIIVTGSTTGIGEAMARLFVAEGAQVLVHGRERARGEEIVASLGVRAALCIDDLADLDAPERIVRAALDAFGRIDGLVNNAAIVTRNDLANTDAAFFDLMIAVNLRAPLLLVRAAAAELKKTKGAILNIGSINAYSGESHLVAYSVSKGGLMTLSKNLADSLCYDGVRVTHFNAGWVLTPNEYLVKLKDGLPPNWPELVTPEQAPNGRLMRPEEIAAAAVYWLSDESRPISGSVIDLEQYPFVGRNPTKKGTE